MELYYQATGSKAATVALMIAFALCMFGAACANITSSSRLMWAASRDNCYPFSKYWKQIHTRWNMPFNVVCLTGTFTTVSTQSRRSTNINPIIVIRLDLSWFIDRLCFHGGSMYRFYDNLMYHSSGNCGMARTGKRPSKTFFRPWRVGTANKYHLMHMGRYHRYSLLFSHRNSSHKEQHELDKVF